jgi:O-antigen/teichoic acid export membrane protein
MSEAAGRSFAASVALLAIVRLLGVAAGFAISIIGARALGDAGFGAAGVAITIGTVAALVGNGGVNIAIIYLAGRHPAGPAAVIGATATIAVAGAALAFAMPLLAGLLLGDTLKLGGREALFVAAGALGAAIIGYEYGGALLLAISRQRTFAGIELVRWGVALAFTVLLLAIAPTDLALVLAGAIGYLAAALTALAVTHRLTGAVRPGWHPELIRASLALGLRGQVGNVLQFMNLRLDLLLIAALLPLSAAGVYLVAVRASEVLMHVSSSAGSLIFPAVAGHPDPTSATLTQRTVRVSLLLVAAAALVLILVADPLLAIAFGPPYAPASASLRILAVAMLPLSLSRILAGDLKGRGRLGIVSVATLAALAWTLGLDLLLIPVLGIEGAAVASLAAYAVSATILLAAFRAVTGTSLRLLLPRASDAVALLRLALRPQLAAR